MFTIEADERVTKYRENPNVERNPIHYAAFNKSRLCFISYKELILIIILIHNSIKAMRNIGGHRKKSKLIMNIAVSPIIFLFFICNQD